MNHTPGGWNCSPFLFLLRRRRRSVTTPTTAKIEEQPPDSYGTALSHFCNLSRRQRSPGGVGEELFELAHASNVLVWRLRTACESKEHHIITAGFVNVLPNAPDDGIHRRKSSLVRNRQTTAETKAFILSILDFPDKQSKLDRLA